MNHPDAEELLDRASELSDKGKKEDAIAAYLEVIALAPDWSVPYYNLGLLYKYDCEWEKSFQYNQKAAELAREDEAAWWNLGTAATALKKWRIARQAWNFFGLNYELTDDDPAGLIARCPVRINADADNDADTEVVWCRRIDPARTIIENIPLPGSRHRLGDLILNDGAPIGSRMSEGREYPVFNEIQLLEPSNLHTWSVRLKNCKPKHKEKLLKLCKAAGVAAEDWSTLLFLCRKCSEGVVHEDHDEDLKNQDSGDQQIAFASATRKPIEQVLLKWRVLTLHSHSKLVLELE